MVNSFGSLLVLQSTTTCPRRRFVAYLLPPWIAPTELGTTLIQYQLPDTQLDSSGRACRSMHGRQGQGSRARGRCATCSRGDFLIGHAGLGGEVQHRFA